MFRFIFFQPKADPPQAEKVIKLRIKNLIPFSHDEAGFTLFELLIVIGILSIMAAVLFANSNAGQATLAAQRSTQLVVEALREAENNALGAKVAGSPSAIPLGGWGVSFHAGSDPILFADVDGNHEYDAGTDVLVSTIVLDEHAPIAALSAIGGNGNLDVVFLAPNPSVYINGIVTTPASADATITVTATFGGSATKVVHVNAIGAISVE